MKDLRSFKTNGAGVMTLDDLRNIPGYPEDKDFEKGPVAVIECSEDIPCNPCEDICEHNAISVGEPITNLPDLDADRCKGCLKCITICPGLCIFVIYKNYTDRTSLIYIPYEFTPLPGKDTEVDVLNREGEKICRGYIRKVLRPGTGENTAIIGLEVTKEFFDTARHFTLR